MSNLLPRGAGRYTTFFTSVSASDVNVPGLAPGSAGSRSVPNHVLTSLAALFTIGPDTVDMMAEASRRGFIPARPAAQIDMMEPELLAAD